MIFLLKINGQSVSSKSRMRWWWWRHIWNKWGDNMVVPGRFGAIESSLTAVHGNVTQMQDQYWESVQAEFSTGFDGFLVENMIFEIHLNNAGLLICVEFEINYSLNITLSLFSLQNSRKTDVVRRAVLLLDWYLWTDNHVNYGQGQLTMDGGHFCEFIVLLDFEGGVSKCIIIGNSQALRVYSRRYSKRTCILDNQNWISCQVVDQTFKTKCHTIVENCHG